MAKKISKRKRIERKKREEVFPFLQKRTKIQVIGIGGGGGQIVSEIAKLKKVNPALYSKRGGVKFLVANTDLQALKKLSRNVERFQFGQNITSGLGTGMDPDLGERAALEDLEKIKKIFKDQDFSIIISCLGGGTGSGATPVFAKISKDLKNYTLGIFTLPFLFEGKKRMEIANLALEKIRPNLNAIILIPNERIFQIIDEKSQIKEAFSAVNKILAENLEGLIEILFLSGVINIDFADLKTILAGKGRLAFLNTVIFQGENRAEEAAKKILENPLYEYSISGAERILFNISGSKDLKMAEVEKISQKISDFNKRAKIIFGISQKENLKDSLKITLLAVGCGQAPKIIPQKKKKRKSKKIKKAILKSKRPPLAKKPKIEEAKPEPEIEKEAPEEPPFAKASGDKEEKIEIKTRRNALEIKKELEKTAQEILAKESQWEIPAFLRRKPKKGQT